MHEISVIGIDRYPETLRNIPRPPNNLYIRGTLPVSVHTKYLCVVGSRNWTHYGREALERVLSDLRGLPISIVSGLAVGIDSISHTLAMKLGLHCVAFPGSTLEWDAIYPQEHRTLAEMILDHGGALLSEFPPGYKTGKWIFPSRNRLMAGISHATLIVEAARKSGSLLTAKYAEDFGRDVMAIPGSIFADNSYGTNMLISKGATPITRSKDLAIYLGFETSTLTNEHRPSNSISPGERIIVQILNQTSRVNVDHVVQITGMTVTDVIHHVSSLELQGIIRNESGILSIVNS